MRRSNSSLKTASAAPAGAALFGVADYVPALMEYVQAYGIGLNFGHTLVRVNGPAKIATFRRTGSDGKEELVDRPFDMLHVVLPQVAPDFIRVSPLADAAGWVDVDQFTLRHKVWPNVYGLGDVANTPNAKTAAAARKLAPSFPRWLLDGTRPSRLAWLLKERILPPLYWKGMLKGREWLAKPELADQ